MRYMPIPNAFRTAFIPSLLLLTAGCTKDQQEDLKLEAELLMRYNSIAFTVDPTEQTGDIQLTIALDGSALADMLSANGYDMSQLKEFKFTDAEVRLAEQNGLDYDALQRAVVDLALSGGNPVTIASIDPVPDDVQMLDLVVNEVNVADIMRHQDIGITLKLTTDQAITDTMHQVLDLGGKVVVQL